MNMYRAAVRDLLWKDICDIYSYDEVKEGVFTEHKEVLKHENVPCKLSFSSYPSATQTPDAAAITQSVKLFLDKDIEVKANSKIVVHRDSREFIYKNSGEPAVFNLYLDVQEINLELFEGWA